MSEGQLVSDLTFGLITVSAPYEGNGINEKTDTERLNDIEYPIVGISSNYGKKFDPNYEKDIIKIIKKQKKGRRPKKKVARVPKSNCGSGKDFDSQITIFIHDTGDPGADPADPNCDHEKIYGVKVFRKDSIQLPGGCKDIGNSRRIIENVIHFINTRLDKNIKIIRVENTLTNMKGRIEVPEQKGFSLRILARILEREQKQAYHYTGDTALMKVYHNIKKNDKKKTLQVNITQYGKINYIGHNDPEYIRQLHKEIYTQMIAQHRDELIVDVYNG